VVNGIVERRWETADSRLDVTDRLPLAETSWIAARVFGPRSPEVDSSPIADEPGQVCGQFAHTSPVYVRVGGAAFRPRKSAADFCLRWLEAMAEAVSRVREQFLRTDLSRYSISAESAFERVMSRIVEARRAAHNRLTGGTVADE